MAAPQMDSYFTQASAQSLLATINNNNNNNNNNAFNAFQPSSFLDSHIAAEPVDFTFDGKTELGEFDYTCTQTSVARPEPLTRTETRETKRGSTQSTSSEQSALSISQSSDHSVTQERKKARTSIRARGKASASTVDTNRKTSRKRGSITSNVDDDSPEAQKRCENLAKNAQAAAKCRQKKKEFVEKLQENSRQLTAENSQLLDERARLENELHRLQLMLIATSKCDSCSVGRIDVLKAALGSPDGLPLSAPSMKRSNSDQSMASGNGYYSQSNDSQCKSPFDRNHEYAMPELNPVELDFDNL